MIFHDYLHTDNVLWLTCSYELWYLHEIYIYNKFKTSISEYFFLCIYWCIFFLYIREVFQLRDQNLLNCGLYQTINNC